MLPTDIKLYESTSSNPSHIASGFIQFDKLRVRISVMEGSDGKYVLFPSNKYNGKYYDQVYFVTKEDKDAVVDKILEKVEAGDFEEQSGDSVKKNENKKEVSAPGIDSTGDEVSEDIPF